ncbi:MAG TPA: hypothetical protein VIS06_17280 [Mycobacteriales bacterium]
MTDNPVPMPLRAAAGLAALAIDEARRLPRRLVGLPVLAVSGAMQASLRVQQGYTELAVRGDQLLAQLRPGSPEETPPWARFDEDEPKGGTAMRIDVDTGPSPSEPLPLPDYDGLSIAQLRDQMRLLTAADVQRLVAHERATANRAPYLTLLENRLVALLGD